MNRLADLRNALVLAWRAGPALLLGFLLTAVLGAVVPITVAWLTKLVLDRIGGGDQARLLALGLAAVGVLAVVLPHTQRYLSEQQERLVTLIAGDELYRAVNGFVGLGRFEDPAFLDRLRLAQQSGGTTPSRVVDGLFSAVRAGLMTIGYLGSLIVLNPAVAVIVLLSAAPILAAELTLSRRRAAMLWQIGPLERREFFYGTLLTGVEAAKETRLFGIGDFLRARMRAERLAANVEERRTARRELATQGALSVFSAAVAGAGLIWVIGAATSGGLSIGDIALFVAALAGVQGGLGSLVGDVGRTHHQLVMFGHHRAVVGADVDLPIPAHRELPPLRRGVELHDVWFRYSDDHPWILRGVSLTIAHGTSVGLVGLNGAGKSTLVKLLCRFYDPVRGSITWDGVDLRDVDPAELRRRIGAVFQDHMSYDLTATENIALGDLRSLDDPDRVRAAAHGVGLHRTLTELPRGYETLLSRIFFGDSTSDADGQETGVQLSGGQWQRLALARAIVRDDCELLILDEPSSGLDAEAEADVHRRLRAHRAGRSSLLISHRLSALRDADSIVVLDDGRISEQGAHADLVNADRGYARLYALQAQGYAS